MIVSQNQSSQFPSAPFCNNSTLVVQSSWIGPDSSDGTPRILVNGDTCDDDLKELLTWSGRDRDFLGSGSDRNISFHPLPSGSYCLSRTFRASNLDEAISIRRFRKSASTEAVSPPSSIIDSSSMNDSGGLSSSKRPLYTQNLVFSESTLAQFDNHPLLLLEAIRREGIFHHQASNGRLPSACISNKATVSSIIRSFGGNHSLMKSYEEFNLLLSRESAIVVFGRRHLVSWFHGLFDSLPAKTRKEVHFCTNLRFSSQRPFRITGIGNRSQEERRIRRKYDLTVWNTGHEISPKNDCNSVITPDLVHVWHVLRESIVGQKQAREEQTCIRGRELWADYQVRNIKTVEQARESLLELSIATYCGMQNLQINQPQQIDAMMDVLDMLLN